MDAVDVVVRGHDGPRLCFPDRNLEVPEVDLPQRPFAEAGVVVEPVQFLAVHREMLHRGADAVGLDAGNHGRGHLAGEQRVLAVILEVPAAERVAVDIHPRTKDDIDAVFQHLVAHRPADFLHEFRVPGRGEHRPDREAGAVEGLLRSFPVRVDPQAGGTVRQDDRGDAEPRDGMGRAGCTGNALVGVADAVERLGAAAHEDGRLLFQGHRRNDVADIVRGQLRRLEGHHSGKEKCNHGFNNGWSGVSCSRLRGSGRCPGKWRESARSRRDGGWSGARGSPSEDRLHRRAARRPPASRCLPGT